MRKNVLKALVLAVLTVSMLSSIALAGSEGLILHTTNVKETR